MLFSLSRYSKGGLGWGPFVPKSQIKNQKSKIGNRNAPTRAVARSTGRVSASPGAWRSVRQLHRDAVDLPAADHFQLPDHSVGRAVVGGEVVAALVVEHLEVQRLHPLRVGLELGDE